MGIAVGSGAGIIRARAGRARVDVTVLGSGTMGHGIAQISAMAGHSVILRDIKQELLDGALEKIKWSLSKSVEKKKITQAEADDTLSRIKTTTDLGEAASKANIIVEAVPEIMDLKKKVYAELDAVARADATFASNTSTLPITEIAASTADPTRFVGVHFFNPPQIMKLVEIIPGRLTDQAVLERIAEL